MSERAFTVIQPTGPRQDGDTAPEDDELAGQPSTYRLYFVGSPVLALLGRVSLT
ncbi:hypothetical protein [uncultured Serinicoccus sp.]|uniref:hypothetical protein n=1 Tax=uncultured Serinicoccus sp. TaxID=735514 RepID=UPI0026037276|nr:hypothetical protein [uncultured Serinicoccus sp.]